MECPLGITLFLVGDVMTGRGIDQILPYPGDPTIHEPYLKSAKKYVEIAEEANGPIAAPVSFPYIWGDALAELERAAPDVRIINLETSITGSDDFWEDKDIHYRMNPKNIACLTAAKIDFCSLANNHILDWGYSGLQETLETLRKAKMKFAGAGRNLEEAGAPAVMEVYGKGRVIIFSFGAGSSGIPLEWGALKNKPGVNLVPDLSFKTIQSIAGKVRAVKRERDIVVASIHWGRNWGYEVSPEQISFAHGLIEEAGVDLIHGHSSHHVKQIEVFRGKLILYSCGDFLNDYEGISGYEAYRGDLTLMYFVRLDPPTGKLVLLWMIPMQIKNFRLNRASQPDARWLREVLHREGKTFGTRVILDEVGALRLQGWEIQSPLPEIEKH
jgi:poly-gamma-glutamate capsule biosynthesis protein CapA/YwtB (metallophosphatase superfamily)